MSRKKPNGNGDGTEDVNGQVATAESEVPAPETPVGETNGQPDAPAAQVDPVVLPTPEEEIATLRAQLAEAGRTLRIRDEADRQRQESVDRVSELEAEMNRTKKIASAAKNEFELAVEDHFALERRLKTGQQMLPLGDPAPAADGGEVANEDESWKNVPLASLDLSMTIAAKLLDANLVTIGDLTKFLEPSASGHTQKLIDIKGIGETKAAAIEEALQKFWASRAAADAPPAPPAAPLRLHGADEPPTGETAVSAPEPATTDA